MIHTPITTCYIDEALSKYSFGAGHPFNAGRYHAFVKAFYENTFDEKIRIAGASFAEREDLISFHDPDFVSFIEKKSREGTGHLDYGDTPAVRGIHEAALCVVGTSLSALDEIMGGITDRAFLPIGGLHHGKPKSASGFCVYNDVGIVIQKAFKVYGLTSVLYVDIDAHFGDGVYYAFESDPRLHTFDWHQEHLFPGSGFVNETGRGAGKGHKKNILLKMNSTDEDIEPFVQELYEFALKCQPHLIILQAGADCLKGDPLAQLHLTAAVHQRVAALLAGVSDHMGHRRFLAFGGGGYHLPNVAQGWCSVLKGMMQPQQIL